MRARRVVVFALAAILLAAALWLAVGNARASRREERSDLAWTATFGSLDDLKKKYPKYETNETAKRLEELTRGSAFDLTPRRAGEPQRPAESAKSQGTFDFLSAQIARPEASIDAPSAEVLRFFEEERVTFDSIESTLIAGPPPAWSFDRSVSENDRLLPNGLGHIRLQRVLMARALVAAKSGRHEDAARSLDASWNLNEPFRRRPETMPSLLGIAIARLEVGVLRKVNVDENLWRKRLSTLDPRGSLLDAFTLESRSRSAKNSSSRVWVGGDDPSWYQRVEEFLGRPMNRLAMAEYSDPMRDEFERLRKAPLSDSFPEPSNPDVRDVAHIISAISTPNIKNSFLRADRLVVDAELTSKILEARQLRRENGGRWPATIAGIETSRFPGASWRCEVSSDGRRCRSHSAASWRPRTRRR